MDKGIAGAPAAQAAEMAAAKAADIESREAAAKAQAEQAARAQAAKAQAEQAEREARAQALANATPPTVPGASDSAAKVGLGEVAELRALAEAERDRLSALGSEYDARLTRERNRDRVAALRTMGAVGSLTDEQLLAITPDVDPHAPGGAAKLDEWREKNEGLFAPRQGPTIPSPDELLAQMPQQRSASGLYDAKYFADLMKRNLGG